MTVTVITPTCDRPMAFALAERWMARQTRQPDQWIVADGGRRPVVCGLGQLHLHAQSFPGAANFASNLLRAIPYATGDVVVFWEDDDWYASTHLETLTGQLGDGRATIAGDDCQRYYHLPLQKWRTFDNVGASLCQTAMRRELLPLFRQTVEICQRRNSYGVDRPFWEAVPRDNWSLVRSGMVLGMKGLPGQAGLGIGHRPDGIRWVSDSRALQLRAWIGDDADVYADLAKERCA